jgi:hypothetical protein
MLRSWALLMIIASYLLAGSLAVALWFASGLIGLVYAILFGAAVLPGLPLGFALAGRRHPLSWVGGALIGYGLTQLSLWAVIALGFRAPLAFVAGWLAVTAASVLIARAAGPNPVLVVPDWSRADLRSLLLVLLLVPVLMGHTYRNLGRSDAQGNTYYRAYFTADFLWHAALASELGKFTLPPRNPYLASEPIHYYWTYFLLPATAASLAPAWDPEARDVKRLLETNAILAGTLMLAALFLLVRTGTQSAGPAAAAVVLTVLASSAEGLYATVDLLRRGLPLAELLDTNVDAISNWVFGGLRIDNIPRSLWYTPQHTTSIALGLVGITIGVLGGARARLPAIAAAGLALGLSTTMNPLLGAVCSMLYGLGVLADWVRDDRRPLTLLRHGAAAIFVLGAVGWAAVSRVADGAGSALHIGIAGYARNHPVLTLLLSLGPVLVPAIPGVLGARTPQAVRAAAVAAGGVLLGLFLLYFVRISEASWVGFRAGQILLVAIPVLLARSLERVPRRTRGAAVALILALGLPTTLVDAYNAQDIWNRRPGPGFRWTLWTTRQQRQAFEWIKRNTPEDAIVQMEPVVRGREHWTLIPSFAGRRMAAGDPISLLPIPEYALKSGEVRTMFATGSAADAAAIARRLGIDYIYVDQTDVSAYPEGVAKFDGSPAFERVFSNREVRLYRVR